MTAKTTTGGIPFEFGQGNKDSRVPSPRRPSGKSFNLLAIGDFLGNTPIKDNTASPARTKPLKIDRDNLEEVMAKLQPSLSIPIAEGTTGNTVDLCFTNLDDFHPDHIFEEVSLFAEFRSLRKKLKKDSSFEAAAKKMDLWLSTAPPPSAPAPQPDPSHASTPVAPPTEGLLDSILGGDDSPATKDQADTLVTSLIQDAVAAYATPAPNPNKQMYLDSLDQVISRSMAAILHHPDFQALESAWRGMDMLTRRVETDSQLTLRLLPLSKQALLVDLASPEDATQSEFAKLIHDAPSLPQQEDRWSTVLGLYHFSDHKNDALMLGILAKVMAHADTPFIAAGDSRLVKSDSFFYQPDPADWQHAQPDNFLGTWNAIRQLPEAQYIALASPRFLVRYPYGKKSQRIESFDLEETDSTFKAEHFLWCNGAIAHGIGICQSFSQQHWRMSLGDINTLERLPLAFYDDDGESSQIPSAEIFLTQQAFDTITDAGLAPLISVKGSDHLQLGPLLSIHQQRLPLKGPWDS